MVEKKVLRMTQLAILAALIVLLQFMFYFVKIGPFNLALALIPIIIGGALFGPRAGAGLGFVFGVVVVIACAMGLDGGLLWTMKPGPTAIICILKGTLAGFTGALVHAGFSKLKKPFLGVIASAIVTPLVNTGLFTAGVWLFLLEPLTAMSQSPDFGGGSGQSTVAYFFLVLVGTNFLFEFALNVVLAPIIERITNAVRRVAK